MGATEPATEQVAPADREDAIAALVDELGWRLVTHRMVAQEARENGFVTGHELEVDTASGRELHTVYLDGDRADRPGTVALTDATGRALSAWLYPRDPALPALAALVYPDAAAVVLARLGIDSAGLALSVPSYRPGKRAVVRLHTDAGIYFAKVVKPELVEPIRTRHELWRAAGIPVPEVIASAPEGVLILTALQGVELSTALATTTDTTSISEALREIEGRIHGLRSESSARSSLGQRVSWYTARLRTLAAASGARVDELEELITTTLRTAQANPRQVTIHGDLHLGQVFVDPHSPATVTGVLDIDTAGLGDPADDAAALWAHLVVTAELRERDGERGNTVSASPHRALAASLESNWHRENDTGFESRVRAIAATHLLGHALSGAIAADRALELAHETLLIPDS